MPTPRNRKLTDYRGRRLNTFEANQIRRNFGTLWRSVQLHDSVAITRDGDVIAVMLSAVGFLDLIFGKPKARPKQAGRRRR